MRQSRGRRTQGRWGALSRETSSQSRLRGALSLETCSQSWARGALSLETSSQSLVPGALSLETSSQSRVPGALSLETSCDPGLRTLGSRVRRPPAETSRKQLLGRPSVAREASSWGPPHAGGSECDSIEDGGPRAGGGALSLETSSQFRLRGALSLETSCNFAPGGHHPAIVVATSGALPVLLEATTPR